MTIRRRKPVPPAPPPPRGIVLDGSNVTASATSGAPTRVVQALAWAREWAPSLPVVAVFDHATLRRLGREVEDAIRAVCASAGAEVRVTEPFVAADPGLLAFASASRSLVLSNDRFWDYEDLRRDVIVVQFQAARGEFRVLDEATWFLPSGAARRVAMKDIRPAG